MPTSSPPRLSDLRFAFGCVLAALGAYNVVHHPQLAALGSFLIWASIAVLEAVWPRLRRSPAPVEGRTWPLVFLRLYVPIQLALLALGLHAAGHADGLTVLGLAFAVGFITGAQGITYAHELGHRRGRLDRALGWILMGSVNYGQFMVEHYRGHHVRAATWEDPASGRLGESLWRFLPRTLAGSWRGAWQLEATRLRKFGLGWHRSPLAWCSAVQAVVLLALLSSGSWRMLVFWVVQSAFAIWLLETVNYIEHYGLQRQAGTDGRREPFGVTHAWNADHAISNTLLANLQRHSDHHMHAWKAFPELAALPGGPTLPTGYAGCILIAAIPPWWFALVHPRLQRAAGEGRWTPQASS